MESINSNKFKIRLIYTLCFCLVGIVLIYNLIIKNNQIKPSSLPQHQLWDIEHAEKMLEAAYNIGISMVLNEEALLALVKQAWQWDKNAMIQYAKIIDSEWEIPADKEKSLNYFLIKYRAQIVDDNGRLLINEPSVLRLPFHDLMRLLADQQYPWPARVTSARMMGYLGFDENRQYIPYDAENARRMANYIRYSIAGGYHYYQYLADTILFRTGDGKKSRDYRQINMLTERFSDISRDELIEAVTAYKTCSYHGSSYCATRLAEAYTQGVGVEANLATAYAWGMIANQLYDYFLKSVGKKNIKMEKGENDYNNHVLVAIKEKMNKTEIEQAELIRKDIESKIQNWDYYTWVRGRDNVPPMP